MAAYWSFVEHTEWEHLRLSAYSDNEAALPQEELQVQVIPILESISVLFDTEAVRLEEALLINSVSALILSLPWIGNGRLELQEWTSGSQDLWFSGVRNDL